MSNGDIRESSTGSATSYKVQKDVNPVVPGEYLS